MTSLVTAVSWALVWFAHTRWLRREPAAAEPLRARHQVRLESHGVAVVALAIGATGVGRLLGLAIEAAFGGSRGGDGVPLSETLREWVPFALVGLVVWAWAWSRVLARRRTDPDEEANSAIRRTFLYLTLAGGLIVALGSAAVVLYRLVGTVIGAGLEGSAIDEIAGPIGALLTAAVVLGYHGLVLRGDQRLRPADAAVAEVDSPAARGSVGGHRNRGPWRVPSSPRSHRARRRRHRRSPGGRLGASSRTGSGSSNGSPDRITRTVAA